MRNLLPIRPAAPLLLVLLLACSAQGQTLPPSRPTQVATPVPSRPGTARRPHQRADAEAGADEQPYRAQVSLIDGLLAVTAQNSSLNQILRDIAHLNRMTITGGVDDERVYGTYGPAPAALILSQLLDGTKTNILLREDAQNVIQELVLTPRGGGPTPANPNALSPDAQGVEADLPPAPGGRRVPGSSMRPQLPDAFSQPQPPSDRPSPEAAPGAAPDPATNPAAADGDTTQQSPNGVQTPEQMLEELKKREQQATDPASIPNPPESLPEGSPGSTPNPPR